jgi:hypothetical protein
MTDLLKMFIRIIIVIVVLSAAAFLADTFFPDLLDEANEGVVYFVGIVLTVVILNFITKGISFNKNNK